MLGSKEPKEGSLCVREQSAKKRRGLDLCLEDILVKGLGFGIDREIHKRVFLSREERFWPWQRANFVCSCFYVLVAI